MIRKLNSEDDLSIIAFLKRNVITNYFIILGLERSAYEEMFIEKWGEYDNHNKLIAVMFKRKTGNVQFYSSGDYNAKSFSEILKTRGFNKLIGEETILKKLKAYCHFSKEEMGPFISKLNGYVNCYEVNNCEELKKLEINDLTRVIELYKKTFPGFATMKSMTEKLENGSGRGYYLEKGGEIVSIVQTTYEEKNSALITGVATHPDYRRLGYASMCLSRLISELTQEEKVLYLQYDNEGAGSIYKKMGFYDIGRMVFYY